MSMILKVAHRNKPTIMGKVYRSCGNHKLKSWEASCMACKINYQIDNGAPDNCECARTKYICEPCQNYQDSKEVSK